MNNNTYTYTCSNITTLWRRADTGLLEKIYLSLYWKGCVWVGDWKELQHIDPHSYDHNSVSFPFSWAAQPGTWGPSLCWDMLLIPSSSLQLIWGSELQLLNRGSWGPPLLGAGSLYSTLSPTAAAQSGVLRAPSAECWFSLQHLISN